MGDVSQGQKSKAEELQPAECEILKKLIYDCFVMYGNNKYKEAPQI